MSQNSESQHFSRRHFLSAVGSVAAASSIGSGRSGLAEALPPPPPSIDFPVAIDVTDPKNIKYSSVGVVGSANPLNVKPGHRITWKAITPNGDKYNLTVKFKNNVTPFFNSGTPVTSVSGSNQDEGTIKIGGVVDQKADNKTFFYSVAVCDEVTGITYVDDTPRMIVGTGNSAKQYLEEAKASLEAAAEALPDHSDQQTKVRDIEGEVKKVINQLDAQKSASAKNSAAQKP